MFEMKLPQLVGDVNTSTLIVNWLKKEGDELNLYGLTPIGFTASGFACPLSVGRLHLQAYACSISGGIKI